MKLLDYIVKTSSFSSSYPVDNQNILKETETYKKIESILRKYRWGEHEKDSINISFKDNKIFVAKCNINALQSKYVNNPVVNIGITFSSFPSCCGAHIMSGWFSMQAHTLAQEYANEIKKLMLDFFFLVTLYRHSGRPFVCIGVCNNDNRNVHFENWNPMKPYIVGGEGNRLEFKNLGYDNHGLDLVLVAHPMAHKYILDKSSTMFNMNAIIQKANPEI